MIIYAALVAWVLISSLAPVNSILKNRYVSSGILFSLIALLIVSIPFNDFSEGDMPRYIRTINMMSDLSFYDSLQYFDWEPLFTLMQWSFAQVSNNSNLYIIFILIIYISLYYRISAHLFYNWQRLFFFFSYLSVTFFHAYLFNGTRQGFAMALILLAIALWNAESPSFKKIKVLLSLMGAALFHTSSIPLIVALLFLMAIKPSLKSLLIIWAGFSVLFITEANTLIANIPYLSSIEYLVVYTDEDLISHFGEVNKMSYYIFSLTALIASLILHKLPLNSARKAVHLNLIKTYLIFNSVFLAFGFIAYSNRIATFSWILIPLLMIYPILHSKVNARYYLFAATLIFTVIGFATSAYEFFQF